MGTGIQGYWSPYFCPPPSLRNTWWLNTPMTSWRWRRLCFRSQCCLISFLFGKEELSCDPESTTTHTVPQCSGCQSSQPSLPTRLTDLFRALHISMVTRTESAIVIGYGDSKIAQSTPSKSGLSSLHCRKWLCNKSPIKFLISQIHCPKSTDQFHTKSRTQTHTKTSPHFPQKLSPSE